jgi:hypothetical protein
VIEPQEMDEIERHKNEPAQVPISSDPFKWWQERKNVYSCLERIARRVFAIPATTVPCKRIFSDAGNVLTKKRSRMNSDTLSMILLCLKTNGM